MKDETQVKGIGGIVHKKNMKRSCTDGSDCGSFNVGGHSTSVFDEHISLKLSNVSQRLTFSILEIPDFQLNESVFIAVLRLSLTK